MFSIIHNSPTVLKHLPTAGLPAFMAAFAIAMVAGSASAYAHCERHVYNNSQYVWRMQIQNQPSNNLVDYTLQPGESNGYWIITDGTSRVVKLTSRQGGDYERSWVASSGGHRCYFNHDMTEFNAEGRGLHKPQASENNLNPLSWNEPADGDVTICAYGLC